MHHVRRNIAAFSTALILGCGAFAASAPAAFAATCSGTGCDGQDPYSTGCAGSGASYYVAETTPLIQDSTGMKNESYGYIQLWWSNTCGTNWTRMVVSVGGGTLGVEEVTLARPNSKGDYDLETFSGGSKGAYVSDQLYAAGIPAESRGYLYGSGGPELYHATVAQPGF